MKYRAWLIVLTALVSTPGVALDPTSASHPGPVATAATTLNPAPDLDAVLWEQQSQEYRAVTRNVYAHARLRLAQALAEPSWSASVEQIHMSQPYPQPTAIILDIDETVLDNSPLYARLARNANYDLNKGWASWTDQAQAKVLEGAVDFIDHALNLGVHVFFVSNRSCTQDDATRKNMAKVGFPVWHPNLVFISRNTDYDDPEKRVRPPCTAMEEYVKREFGIAKPVWSSYKSGRRAAIATRYRILLQFGDSQGDFFSLVPPDNADPAERKRLLAGHLTVTERNLIQRRWGAFFDDRWMALPNAMYGNWMNAINDYQALSVEERARLDASKLDTGEPGEQ